MEDDKKPKEQEPNYDRFAWKEKDIRIIKWPPRKKNTNDK